MSAPFGLHLPPVTRPFTHDEIGLVKALHPSAIVALIYEPHVVPEMAEQVAELVDSTEARLLLRPYVAAPILHYTGLEWGRMQAEWIAPYLGLRPWVVPDNEPNDPADGGVTDPARIAEFWSEAAEGLRLVLGVNCPGLLLPPLSPVGNYRDAYQAIALLGLHHQYDGIAAHCYERTGNWADVAWLKDLFGYDVWVTEFDSWRPDGTYAPTADCLAQVAGAEAACWFTVSSDNPSFDFCSLVKHPEVITMAPQFQFGFKDLAGSLGEAVVGKPVEQEHPFGDNYNSQMTTKGLMVYSKEANQPGFIPFAQPEG